MENRSCYPDEKFFAAHDVVHMRLEVKEERQPCINNFQSTYYSSDCSNNIERKTCVWSSGGNYSWQCSWQDKPSGITWVAVHGINSICVIIRKKLDKNSVGSRFFKTPPTNTLFYQFMESIIYEIENGSFHKFEQTIKKPFGVVSMVPNAKKFREENGGYGISSGDYDEDKAIKHLTEKIKTGLTFTSDDTTHAYDEKASVNFLREKMKTDTALTSDDTIHTAISALQHLCRKKFKPHQILGCVMKENKTCVVGLPLNQIKIHLAVINNLLLRFSAVPFPLRNIKRRKRTRSVAIEDDDSTLLSYPKKKQRTKMEKNIKRRKRMRCLAMEEDDSTASLNAKKTRSNMDSAQGQGSSSRAISVDLSKLTIV